MAAGLKYKTLERIAVKRPVPRVTFISELCRGKTVLDLGCFDETAQRKRDTEHWLHGRIAAVARHVTGIDNSSMIPPEGLITAANALIMTGDGSDPAIPERHRQDIEIIVAGEFIEHLDAPLRFLKNLEAGFKGRELVFSTPNGSSFSNSLLALIGGEAQHPDHLQVFTFKTLNTLCLRAGFDDWEIRPYRFYATELLLQSRGAKHLAVRLTEMLVRGVEWMFPLLSFGYIVKARI